MINRLTRVNFPVKISISPHPFKCIDRGIIIPKALPALVSGATRALQKLQASDIIEHLSAPCPVLLSPIATFPLIPDTTLTVSAK